MRNYLTAKQTFSLNTWLFKYWFFVLICYPSHRTFSHCSFTADLWMTCLKSILLDLLSLFLW